MHLTFIHPAIGHKKGTKYIRTWQMESLPIATLAALTPKDIEIDFFDDRMEAINYELQTDAVAISVETYTAKRAYQIASEFRRRNIPVIMGGFHATLLPDEVMEYAEAVVVGEAESIWSEVMSDLKQSKLKRIYRTQERPKLGGLMPDRTIFADKRYLPIGLIETGRGCTHHCDFCAVASFFGSTHRCRPIEDILEEIESLRKKKKVFFFVDDNFVGNKNHAKALMRSLIGKKIRWITQMSIDAAWDDEMLQLMEQSGCMGVLIGFESLNDNNLAMMNKSFNYAHGGYKKALKRLRHYHIRVYATFVFGYDHDQEGSFAKTVDFAISEGFYIAAFNHLTPFPSTPLYEQLKSEGRLLYDRWWLDDNYKYNDLPFVPRQLRPEDVTKYCVESRRRFYSVKSILTRLRFKVNWQNGFMLRNYLPINWMHRADVSGRDGYPLGDETYTDPLLKVKER